MSRHRNIRGMNPTEAYDEFYDGNYGQSVDEDRCISPSTEAQFMYQRDSDKYRTDSAPSGFDSAESHETVRRESFGSIEQQLNDVDRVKLLSCVEELQNVVGETIPESVLKRAAFDCHYDLEKALNAILQSNSLEKEPTVNDAVTDLTKDEPSRKPDEPLDQVLNSIGRFAFGVQSDGNLPTPQAPPPQRRHSTETRPSLKQLEEPHYLEDDCRRLSIPVRPSSADEPAYKRSPKAAKNKTRSTEAIVADYNRERLGTGNKPLINMVVAGHVDAGKSTLMGHMLYRLGFVSKKAMHRFETDSKKLGKASFLYAWVLDETEEERTRGVTMDVAQAAFETENRQVNVLDAPGHADFIPNMINGAAQADVALLVVDATNGEFEAGFDAGGQTREHTLLLRSLGVSQLAVVVNKLDNVHWDQARYQEIVDKLGAFLKSAGFKDSDVGFVPCSGLSGVNLTETPKDTPELTSWYSGPCLLSIIDDFRPPERTISKPFRLCICDVFKGIGMSGISVSGRIEAGALQAGGKLVIQPSGEACVVKSITLEGESSTVNQAFAGDNVVVTLSNCDSHNVAIGSFLCEPTSLAPVTNRFQARIVLFHNVEIPLTQGCSLVMNYKSMSESVVIGKLLSQINKSNGELIRKRPRCLCKNQAGLVVIEVERSVCIELYKDYKDLGKFMLRSKGATIAAGMVTKIL